MKTKAIFKLIRPYRFYVLLMSALTLIYSLAQVAMAMLMRYVIDSAIGQVSELPFWSAVLVGDIALLVVLYTACSWIAGRTTDKLAASLREKLLQAALYSSDVRLQGFHSGQMLSRGMDDVGTVCESITVIPSLVGQIARLIGAFAAVFVITRKGALLLAAVSLIACTAAAAVRPLLKKTQRTVRTADEKVMSGMQENFQQLELVQSLDAQQRVVSRFRVRLRDSLAAKGRRRVVTVGISSALNAGSLAGTGFVLIWGAIRVARKALSYGSLTSILQLISLFRGPVLELSGVWTKVSAMEVAGERLTDLLKLPDTDEKAQVGQVSAIVFENVTFSYPGEEAVVLNDFSARLPLNNWACLTGFSGRGKTTMFKLILGLYKPDSGRVYLETSQGEVPCDIRSRHLFAYVPQDFALLSGTVEENLRLVSDYDEQKQNRALEIAQTQFLFDLPGGLQTQVKENNAGLSKGQLQRLAIARAILMERRILLLDECTSALDAETELAVLTGLHDLGCQAVLVTHRPSALENISDVTQVPMGI